MERSGPVEELTSGASSRIIPVFRSVLSQRSLLRALLFLQSIFVWILLIFRRGSACRGASYTKFSSRKCWRDEEEDVRRRRALAEMVDMVDRGDKGEEYRWGTSILTGARRNALFCRWWFPVSGDLKANLVIIHGLNEHSGRYLHFAKQLTSCNFRVYAMDWTGHGGSDGLHGYVPSLDLVVADIEIFLEKIKSENPEVPCFLFGHSTGGAVVLKAALYPHIKNMLDGVVLTSPALRVQPAHPIVGAVAPIISMVLPRYQFKGANKRGIAVSRDPAAMLAKYSDPLVYTGPIRVRTGYEILRLSNHLMRNLRSVTVPFLVLHGTGDQVTDPLASEDLYNQAPSTFKDIKLYDGFLHDLLFEPERDEIGAYIIGWMEKRLNR